ncbi:MAG: AI-2E family transporter [Deltaproteobacteria bacterium]|nr:AI-2E family transporter [Deltaproteobacteria bacterium]
MAATAFGIYLCYRLAAPFLPAIVWALALAVLFTPFQRWLESKLKYPSLAAVVTVFVIGLIVVVPGTFVGQRLVLQAAKGAELIETKVQSGELRRVLEAQPRLAPLADRIERNIDLPGIIKTLNIWLSAIARAIVKGSMFQVIGFCLTFYLLFFFLRDRQVVLQSLRYLSPLSEATMDRIFVRVSETIYAMIYGTLAVSFMQGLLGGLMFWWLGLSAPLLWGVVMALLAVVPVLGAFVVWIPAVLILVLEGNWGKALILTLWGVIVVGTIDNLFRPILVGTRLKLHTVLAFMSVVGGLILFGPAGLILGPVILTVTTVFLEIWSRRMIDEAVVRGGSEDLSIFERESVQRLLSQVSAVINKLSKK